MPYPTYYEYVMSESREAADHYAFMLQHLGYNPFEELLNCCQDLIRGVTRKYFLKGYEACDVEQEARQILVEALKDYKLSANMSFMQYFHMCLQNHLNKILRKQQAIKRRATNEAHSLEQMEATTDVPFENFLPKQLEEPCALYCTQESYQQYLEELSTIELQVFERFVAGTCSKEICQELAIEKKVMKRALYRCSAKLRKQVRKNRMQK